MPPVTLSDLCLAAGKPLISASVIGRAGYAGGFCGAAPSYRAIFPDLPAQAASCASAAVLGPAVAALGAVQAQMALSVLIGLEPSPLGRIVTLDMASWRFGGFGFADASEAPGFGFVAATQIVATDTLLDLRPAGTVRAIPAAQVVAPGDLADWPIPAGRVVLCCSTYLRAWRGAQVLAARGATLLDAAGCAAMIARLIPRTALVTPNLPEAARLTGLQSGAAMGALASGFFCHGRAGGFAQRRPCERRRGG